MDFPKTFKDKNGHTWTVHIGLAAANRLRSAGIPLEEFVPMPSAKMARQSPDLSELADLLHGSITGIRAVSAILSPELAKAGISEDAFLESIDDEEIIAAAGQALYQAIFDFFQKSPLRQSLVRQAWKSGKALIAAAARQMDRAMDRVNLTKQIEAIEAIPDEQIDAEIAKMSLQPGKNSVGSLPV